MLRGCYIGASEISHNNVGVSGGNVTIYIYVINTQ